MRRVVITFLVCLPMLAQAQELYIFTDPASNVPAKSLSLKLANRFQQGHVGQRASRQQIEANWGLSPKWMLRTGVSTSDMFGPYRPEAAYTYVKYRFLSHDALKQHFRMAAFAEMGYSRNPFQFYEIDLSADQTGAQAGLIATYLLHKTAISGTISYAAHIQDAVDQRHVHGAHERGATHGVVYNVSVGQLALPIRYKSYTQPNVNVYASVLGQQLMNGQYFVDAAPGLQLILQSAWKLNAGYRIQMAGNMKRMATQGFMLSIEYTFLNALGKKK